MILRYSHDQRSGTAHFLVQQSHSILLMVIAAEGIGTNEFGKPSSFVGIRCYVGPHFMQHSRDARVCDRKSRLAARHAAADNMNWIFHSGLLPRMTLPIKDHLPMVAFRGLLRHTR